MTSQRLYEKWLYQNATQKNSKEAYFQTNIRHHVRINSEQPIAFGFKPKIQQQVPDNTPTAVTHYKKNTRKQVSCAVVMNHKVNDSAVWEKSPANNVNMTFEKLLQDKSRDESQEKPFSKLNSRQNSIDDQQRSCNAITASKKPKIMVPTPTTNYNSNQNENINSSNRRVQESSVHYFTKQLSQVKAFPALKTLDIKAACEQNREGSIKLTQHLSDLLSERQKIQKPQNNQKINKKNTQRCFSMDGVAARRKKSKVPTPDDQSFMCDEEEVVQIPGIDFVQVQEQPMNHETLQYLMLRELEFVVDAQYLRKHPCLNKNMRAILMDWMMEVCAEFNLKRETFHLAVIYVDRFLTNSTSLQKVQLQLLGVTSMFMSAKVEEIYPPSVKEFCRSADYGYTIEQILKMEIKILQTLQWKVTQPSYMIWLNWYCKEWDNYIKDPKQQFRQPTEESYQFFRQITQLIDCAVLDVETLQFKPRQIIASFMYLTTALKTEYLTVKQIIEIVPYSPYFLADCKKNQFKSFQESSQHYLIFSEFARFTFGFNLIDLIPCIQYCSQFFQLQFAYEVPQLIEKFHVEMNGHYEDFIQLQTHNLNNLKFIKKRCN